MGIEERLHHDAEALARTLDKIDKKALIERILAAVDPSARSDSDSADSWDGAGLAEVGTTPRVVPESCVIKVTQLTGLSQRCPLTNNEDNNEVEEDYIEPLVELRGHMDHALFNAQCARRVAELCEWFDDSESASAWWRFAAAEGDEDAKLYVKYRFGLKAEPAGSDLAADVSTAYRVVLAAITENASDQRVRPRAPGAAPHAPHRPVPLISSTTERSEI